MNLMRSIVRHVYLPSNGPWNLKFDRGDNWWSPSIQAWVKWRGITYCHIFFFPWLNLQQKGGEK